MLELLGLFVALALLAVPLVLAVLALVAFVRTQRIAGLEHRVRQLEARMAGQPGVPAQDEPRPQAAAPTAAEPAGVSPFAPAEAASRPIAPPIVAEVVPLATTGAALGEDSRGWEFRIGRSVLGWVAVAALVLAAAIFVRYAFNNEWIGPQGQLGLILAGGCAVLALGYRYALREWRLFSQFLFSAGFVVIYLATYASFGFYQVVSQEVGLVFLLIVVAEAALVALACEGWPVALVGLLGGLATPLLIESPHDQFVSLFALILLLNAGTLLVLWRRPWPALGTVALVGGHGLFWIWYEQFYHPEKLLAALLFQGLLWGLHLVFHLGMYVIGRPRATIEDLVRLLLAAILGFAQVYRLLAPDFSPWLGSVAILLACVYAGMAHLALRLRPSEERQQLAMLAAVLGFVAVAIPLEAQADWVALGWAVLGGALWWFGLRVERGALRGLGAVLGLLAILRMIVVDTPYGVREPFWFLLNGYALPALGVVGALLGSAILTWSKRWKIEDWERTLGVLAGVLGAALLGWVLSWDLFGWFTMHARRTGNHDWVWAGQVAVSILWGAYAAALLAIGFQFSRPVARWLALGLLAFTTLKVFLVDMASVGELYRVLALFCLALVLGGAAWAYQRAIRALRTA